MVPTSMHAVVKILARLWDPSPELPAWLPVLLELFIVVASYTLA